MKIAILSPLTRSPHPDTRGGRSRVVYDLVNRLVQFGHQVSTYATGDAEVPGKLISVIPRSVYNSPPHENVFYQNAIAVSELVEAIRRDGNQYDIIHNHVFPEFLPLLISHEIKTPIVTTIHLYLWPELINILKKFNNTYFVAISDAQRNSAKDINFVDRIYNGVEVEKFEFNGDPKDYFLFFGRMKKIDSGDDRRIDQKGLLDAIKVCQKVKANLYIAGNIESQEFFEKNIRPHLSDKIKFIGPIDSTGPISFREKVELYKNAKGYFSLNHTDEGCPLTPLEAMACGTPVIANRRSSLLEIVKDGETGFIVEENDLGAAIEAVKNIDTINRQDCRKWVEKNFTAEQMAKNYEKVYEKIINKK